MKEHRDRSCKKGSHGVIGTSSVGTSWSLHWLTSSEEEETMPSTLFHSCHIHSSSRMGMLSNCLVFMEVITTAIFIHVFFCDRKAILSSPIDCELPLSIPRRNCHDKCLHVTTDCLGGV